MRPSLNELGVKFGTDKSSAGSEPWMWSIGYLDRVYEPLLEPMRDDPITLLELGFGEYDPATKSHANPDNGGRSAAMWREYFTNPAAVIASVDITPKTRIPDGVHFFRGSQADPEFLRTVHLQLGRFDVIIDDASHVSSLTVAAFKTLWPYLAPGGLYFVEDLHSSYHDYYFGKAEAQRNPNLPGPTAVDFFKRIADEAFFNGQRVKGPAVDGDPRSWDTFPRRYWLGYAVESVTFHAPQIIVIRKRTEDRYPPDTPAVPKHPR